MARKREASLEQMLEKRGLAARGAAVETGRALSGLAARGGVKTSKLEDAVERLAASG
jgi:DNA-binding transcriptional regulator YbjK